MKRQLFTLFIGISIFCTAGNALHITAGTNTVITPPRDTGHNTDRASTSLEAVRTAIRTEYIQGRPADDTRILAMAIDSNGRWADIDYTDNSRSLWQLEKHLDRLIDMALLYEQTHRKDKKLHDAIARGLKAWFDGDFRNGNWWYFKIGIPRRILSLAYILDNDIPASLNPAISSALEVIDSDDYPARPGGDRIQVISNHAKVLMWKRDFDGVSTLFKKIEGEACTAPFEEIMYDAAGGPAVRNSYRPAGRGVQADMTFHHRGDRVNSTLTYGMELPQFFSYWALLLTDTDNRFRPESVQFVIDYYIDAVGHHLVGGRYAEPSIMNRELCRPGEGAFGPKLAEKLIRISGGYRTDELRRYADAQSGKTTYHPSFARFFWQSDYFAFARPEFHTAVRIHSYRNANSEAAHNSEGIRNHFRGDGACMLSVNGREYADIAPVFDFRMIPGATTPLIAYAPLEAWGSVHILDSPTRFAGAVADSLYGAVGFDFTSPRPGSLRARKSWFFFDNEYLCLGSGISAESPDSIVTTIEQCLSPSGVVSTHAGGWYFHSGSAYHVIEGKPIASIDRRSGTWRNCVDNVEYIDERTDADVFSLSIDHGVRPADARYAYAVVPGTTEPVTHRFHILAHDNDIHAVASDDSRIIYMVFYAPGEVDTPAGRFGAEQPCMLMLRDGRLLAADPTRDSYLLKLATPSGPREVLVPTGLLGGTPVEVCL